MFQVLTNSKNKEVTKHALLFIRKVLGIFRSLDLKEHPGPDVKELSPVFSGRKLNVNRESKGCGQRAHRHKRKESPQSHHYNTHQNNKTGLLGAEAASEWSSVWSSWSDACFGGHFPNSQEHFWTPDSYREKKKVFIFKINFFSSVKCPIN